MANLAYGSSGSDVRALQEALRKAGYNIAADGVFGAETQNAVRQYQSAQGLGVDGIAGRQTTDALGIRTGTKDPTQTSYYTGNSGKYQLGDQVGGSNYNGGGVASAVNPMVNNNVGSSSGYDNGGLTTDQIVELQNYYGTKADGLWGQNSKDAAGGLSAQQAWQHYRQQQAPFWKTGSFGESVTPGVSTGDSAIGTNTQTGTNPESMSFSDFYEQRGGDDFEKRLRESINASVQQAVNNYEAQRQETEQDVSEMARQAYVAKLLGEKNMAQRLAAAGYAGGLAESAMLESETNYQNNLAEIQRQKQRALDEIQRAIDNARLTGDLEMASQMADYMVQVQNYYNSYLQQQQALAWNREQFEREMAWNREQAAQAAASTVTPSTGGGTNYGGSSYASNGGVSPTTVMMLQQQINSTLPAGQKIAVDGVWGPATTAAAGGMSASQYLDAYDSYMNRNAFKNR